MFWPACHGSDVLRIGNCSGFYGDRATAMHEMLTGGPLDVLTGDYLAELTMLILARDRARDETLGYAKTFLRQLEHSLGTALENGVTLVANAGGLNPAGLAAAVRRLAESLGLDVAVAHVEGDDLRARSAELGFGEPLAANAYLGAFGIAECIRSGAQVVVTGRVTDASLVVGPAIAHFGWSPSDHRRAGRRGRRRAHPRMRAAGHRRQLRLLRRDPRRAAIRVSRSPNCTRTGRR